MSDIEGSQLSLPRSYTLPREFKYHNKNNERREGGSRFIGSRFYLPSTNSSDGMHYLLSERNRTPIIRSRHIQTVRALLVYWTYRGM
jgi:hypothetical protein